MAEYYRLDGHTPVPCRLEDWASIAGRRPRTADEPGPWRVDRTVLFDTTVVSTVFLGLNHNWDPAGPPELFETMTFGSGTEYDEDAYRTATWDQAQMMHDEIVDRVRDCVHQRLGVTADTQGVTAPATPTPTPVTPLL